MPIFNFKKLPKGFLIAFAAIIIFELINFHFDDYFYNPEPKNGLPYEGIRIKLKNEISQSPQHNYDIIIIGDSHSHAAFMPNIIEAKTGLSCFNLSLFGRMGPLGPYLIVKNYLETHSKKPKYLIVAPFFADAYGTYAEMRWFKQKALTLFSDIKKGNIFTLIKELDLDPGQGIKLMIPSFKHHERIKYIIENPLSFRLPRSDELNSFIRQAILDKGYYPYRINDTWQPPDPEYKLFINNHNIIGLPIHPYIKSILEMAAKNNIKIIYHISPVPYSLYKKSKTREYMDSYRQSILSLKSNYPDFFIFNPQESVSDDALYVNVPHFNKNGSELMSSIFADKVNEIEKTSR